jgi:hypothetical protein
MDRRSMMLMTGIGLLAAAVSVSEPRAYAAPAPVDQVPLPAEPPPPDVGTYGAFLFQDEFDGPPGSAPDPSKWIVQSWDDPVVPPLLGHYRDDRRNVFVDGNSNLVLCATQEGPDFFSGRVQSPVRLPIGTTWEARMKLDCLTPGNWPAFWLLNTDPLPDGEVDVMEWYGNGLWPPGTTVHAASNGKTWRGKSIPELVDNGWHNWRCRWDEAGFRFWRDYVDGAEPYFSVPATPINGRWPFNAPGYLMFPILNLAVGGPGGGDPAMGGVFPSVMLVDWIRAW